MKADVFQMERFVTTVERRRRDKINNWIVQLSKAIPDCNVDYTKTGQVRFILTLREYYSSDFIIY